ncbi:MULTISPECIES: hypothetical protein [Acidithiobacillus]|uniref:hypothetical protein n=1 Tax=Acidithiobacillus ferrooxidans TaxID=920 RepID=UPI001C07A244|nr:hypothetical protein [Acidithiobacillus ferrooxidans]MBU2859744.1 hypothetical protein [Acidithiobacillus ferrooxidans]
MMMTDRMMAVLNMDTMLNGELYVDPNDLDAQQERLTDLRVEYARFEASDPANDFYDADLYAKFRDIKALEARIAAMKADLDGSD